MSLDTLLDDSVAAHPVANAEKAQQILSEVMQQGDEAPAARQPGEPDRKGNPFDPAKHDGTLTARGTWRHKRRNSGSALGGDQIQGVVPEQGMGEPQPPTFDTRAVAESWLDGAFVALPMLLGDEWEPKPEERSKLTDALERYMIAAGLQRDLPPGMALIMAIGVYALPRCFMPGTKARVAKLLKKKEPDDNDVRSDSGHIEEAHAS